ncbi:hypothetical protein C5167_037410 [Papaver somniferum]|uniref:Uncharacterized protein n=1 Tax=Papaver somniferum TaxID=3469 RepID=A0A4Y7IAM1_PAPSO|nr:hypothetical protein C5167_037410 [Papaver somniferum]
MHVAEPWPSENEKNFKKGWLTYITISLLTHRQLLLSVLRDMRVPPRPMLLIFSHIASIFILVVSGREDEVGAQESLGRV